MIVYTWRDQVVLNLTQLKRWTVREKWVPTWVSAPLVFISRYRIFTVKSQVTPTFYSFFLGSYRVGWGLIGNWDKSHWWGKQQGIGHDGRWMWESFPVLSFWDQSPTFKLSNTGDGLSRFCFSISELTVYTSGAREIASKVHALQAQGSALGSYNLLKKSWPQSKAHKCSKGFSSV